MTAEIVLFIGIAAFIAIRGFGEPKLKSSMQLGAEELYAGPVALTRLAVVRFLGTFSGLVAIGAAIAVVLTYWVESIDLAGLSSEATSAGLDKVVWLLGMIRAVNEFLPKVGLALALLPVLLLFVGLLYWFFRSGALIHARIRVEMSELRRKSNNNELEYLPPDRRMQEVEALIAGAQANNADRETTESLYRLLQDLDILRRVDPSLLRQAAIDTPPRPFWLRAMGFMISQTVFKGMTCFARVFVVLATVSLVPASLVFASDGLSEALEQATSGLENAKRDLTLLMADSRARDELDTYREEKKPPVGDGEDLDPVPVESWCDDDNRVLSEGDCATAARFGRAFESLWASRIIAHADIRVSGDGVREGERGARKPDGARKSADGLAAARREWTRRQILIQHAKARASFRGQIAHEADRAPQVRVVENPPDKEARRERAVLEAALGGRSGRRSFDGPATWDGRNAEYNLRPVLRLRPDQITFPADRGLLGPDELIRNAALGVLGAAVDMSETDRQLPDPLGKALAGSMEKGLGAMIQKNTNWRADAAYLARASDTASLSAAVEALHEGRISEGMMKMIDQFADAKTARRYRDALVDATRLQYAKPDRVDKASVALDATWAAPFDKSKVRAAMLKLRPGEGWSSADFLATYSGIFPGVLEQARRNPEAEMLKDLRGGSNPPDDIRNPPNNDPRPPKPGDRPPGSEGGKVPRPSQADAPRHTEAEKNRVSQARSYSRLRGFSRVGGVLIGREPSRAPGLQPLNITDVEYHIEPEPVPGLRMRFTHYEGTEVELGPYNPAIAYFALSYAADGRPTTVTILPALPLHDLKILLHPALVDTAIGCRAIWLDQFVDTFSTESREIQGLRHRARAIRSGLVELYWRGWAYRYQAARVALDGQVYITRGLTRTSEAFEHSEVDSISPPLGSPHASLRLPPRVRLRNPFKDRATETKAKIADEPIRAMSSEAARIIDSELSWNERIALMALRTDMKNALAPFEERSVQFDGRLVDILRKCSSSIRTDLNSDRFLNCIHKKTTSEEMKMEYRNSKYHAWLAIPPDIDQLSGVRERPYTLDRDLQFAAPAMRQDGGQSLRLEQGPFRFIVQSSIDPQAYFLGDSRQWFEVKYKDVENHINQTPWEVKEVEGSLQKLIAEKVSGNEYYRSIYRDMEEFTLLQRLFRAALQGGLGVDFPVERLVALARETKDYVNREDVLTQRWLVRQGALEKGYAGKLERAIGEYLTKENIRSVEDDLGEVIRPCIDALNSSGPSMSTIESVCNMKEAFSEQTLAALSDKHGHEIAGRLQELVDEVIGIRELRTALVDERRNEMAVMTARRCPRVLRE